MQEQKVARNLTIVRKTILLTLICFLRVAQPQSPTQEDLSGNHSCSAQYTGRKLTIGDFFPAPIPETAIAKRGRVYYKYIGEDKLQVSLLFNLSNTDPAGAGRPVWVIGPVYANGTDGTSYYLTLKNGHHRQMDVNGNLVKVDSLPQGLTESEDEWNSRVKDRGLSAKSMQPVRGALYSLNYQGRRYLVKRPSDYVSPGPGNRMVGGQETMTLETVDGIWVAADQQLRFRVCGTSIIRLP
jgi:hypothetical protein